MGTIDELVSHALGDVQGSHDRGRAARDAAMSRAGIRESV
jgi:DNA-binding phage protein